MEVSGTEVWFHAMLWPTQRAGSALRVFPAPALASNVVGSNKGLSLLMAHDSLNRILAVNCSSNPKEIVLAEGIIKTRIWGIRERTNQKGYGDG